MKKLIYAIVCAAALLLSGCCIKHDWSAPSCTEPSVCRACGETGEGAVGHDWQADAGVLVCLRCGAVDDSEERAAFGLPERPVIMPSQPSEENTAHSEYVSDAVPDPRTACDAQPLDEVPSAVETEKADFEKYAIVTDMALNEIYHFTTATRDNPNLLTTGELSVTSFGVLPADSAHPDRAGYQWRYVIMQASFNDVNARKNGVKIMALCEDYYDLVLCGTTQRLDSDGYTAFTVMNDGQEAECRYKRTGEWSDWYTSSGSKREIIYSSLWEIQIPDGYDGAVVGLYSSNVNWEEGEYINQVYSPENFKLFRIS